MSLAFASRFTRAYLRAADELRDNPGQWRVYESKGSCVIVAGPGSGKTKTLTIKMARILAEDIEAPRGIACITFNTECANELKRRLDQLGVSESKNVFIGTVHSFCLKNVVLPYRRLGGIDLPQPVCVAAPSEQRKAFEEALAEVVSPSVDASGWRAGFDRYRRTHLDRMALEWRQDDEQAANLIEKYEALLRGKGLIDFDDMALLGLKLIESHAWVRRSLKARFPVLTIDEYQDLGLPLHRIVRNLYTVAGVRVLAVGDPDQSIYGFAGARPELLSELSRLKDMEQIPLKFNYRSGRTIVNASVAALGEAREYQAKARHSGTVDFHKFPEGLDQQAEKICFTIIPDALGRRRDRKLGDIAVLYLDKNDGDVIEAQARAGDMKFIRVDRGAPYPKTGLIRWLEECAAWCGGGWKAGMPRLSLLLRTWVAFNVSLRSDTDTQAARMAVVRFLFGHRLPKQSLYEWLREFKTACLDEALTREKTLRDEAEALDALTKGCSAKGKLSHANVAVFGGQSGASDHLNLITLHSAKGLEFDVVIMMGMDQGRIPAWNARSVEQKREPRRLFYVGLTRARHEVHMTFSGFTVSRFGRRYDNGPSEFLLEVAKRLEESEGQ